MTPEVAASEVLDRVIISRVSRLGWEGEGDENEVESGLVVKKKRKKDKTSQAGGTF